MAGGCWTPRQKMGSLRMIALEGSLSVAADRLESGGSGEERGEPSADFGPSGKVGLCHEDQSQYKRINLLGVRPK